METDPLVNNSLGITKICWLSFNSLLTTLLHNWSTKNSIKDVESINSGNCLIEIASKNYIFAKNRKLVIKAFPINHYIIFKLARFIYIIYKYTRSVNALIGVLFILSLFDFGQTLSFDYSNRFF